MKKIRFIIILLFVLLFVSAPFAVKAFSVKTGSSIYVAPNEVIQGNLYAAGTNITVDGEVAGDVICGGQSVNINGKVAGDVICGGQSVNINGEVGGSVRIVGNTININGIIAHNVQAFGATISLNSEANVGWDMLIAGANGEIRGNVGQDLHGAIKNLMIAGEIGGDVKFKLGEKLKAKKEYQKSNFIITENAKITGNLIYISEKEAVIVDNASVFGETTHNLPNINKHKERFFIGWAWSILYSIFSALVVGLVLISLWRKDIIKITDNMLKKIGVSIGWGAVIMFLTPIIAILLLFTIIGIPLAIILFAVWLIALFLSKIIFGILIGRNIVSRIWKKQKDSLILAMIIGVVVSWIILSLPIIGWILSVVVIWYGLGGIWIYFKKS